MKKFLIILIIFITSSELQSQRKIESKQDSIALIYARKSYAFIEKQSDSALFYANKGHQMQHKVFAPL